MNSFSEAPNKSGLYWMRFMERNGHWCLINAIRTPGGSMYYVTLLGIPGQDLNQGSLLNCDWRGPIPEPTND